MIVKNVIFAIHLKFIYRKSVFDKNVMYNE